MSQDKGFDVSRQRAMMDGNPKAFQGAVMDEHPSGYSVPATINGAEQAHPGCCTMPVNGAIADPWANRKVGMRCESCVFFVQKGDKLDAIKGVFGRCRRNAPTLKGFPAVWGMDWCGEHRLDENKI